MGLLRIVTAFICVLGVSAGHAAELETCLTNQSLSDSVWTNDAIADCGENCFVHTTARSRSCAAWDGDCGLMPNPEGSDLRVPYGDGPRCLERAPWCMPLDRSTLSGQLALELPIQRTVNEPRPASGTLPGADAPSSIERPCTRSERPPVPPPRSR